MPVRFSPEQFASAARAGEPRAYSSFSDDTSWWVYQEAWWASFNPQEQLPARRHPARPAAWKKATRQHGAIEKARPTAAVLQEVYSSQQTQGHRDRAPLAEMQVDQLSAPARELAVWSWQRMW
jgi:hypothetical protein